MGEGRMDYAEAKRVSDRLRRDGFLRCTPGKVRLVLNGEEIDDPALESAILQEIEGG